MSTEEEVEAQRADLESRSIGPHKSHLMLELGKGSEVFLEVDVDEDLQRVIDAAKGGKELDSLSQWGAIKQDGQVVIVLLLEWPAFELEVVLYFESGKWDVELGLIREAGHVLLSPPGQPATERVKGALAAETPDDDQVLLAALAVRKELRDV